MKKVIGTPTNLAILDDVAFGVAAEKKENQICASVALLARTRHCWRVFFYLLPAPKGTSLEASSGFSSGRSGQTWNCSSPLRKHGDDPRVCPLVLILCASEGEENPVLRPSQMYEFSNLSN